MVVADNRERALALVVTPAALVAGVHRDFGIPFFALIWHIAPRGGVVIGMFGSRVARSAAVILKKELDDGTAL